MCWSFSVYVDEAPNQWFMHSINFGKEDFKSARFGINPEGAGIRKKTDRIAMWHSKGY